MTRKQIEKFAVGYPVPTDWVEALLDYYNGDTNKVHLILLKSQKEIISEVERISME